MTEEEFEQRQRDVIDQHIQNIEEFGFSSVGVFGGGGSDPGFTYTIGNFMIGAPELLIWALDPEIAHALCWDYHERLKTGWTPRNGERRDDMAKNDLDCVLREMTLEGMDQTVFQARYIADIAGRPLDVMNLVWPDANNLFPWDEGFNEKFRGAQPDFWVPGPIDPPAKK